MMGVRDRSTRGSPPSRKFEFSYDDNDPTSTTFDSSCHSTGADWETFDDLSSQKTRRRGSLTMRGVKSRDTRKSIRSSSLDNDTTTAALDASSHTTRTEWATFDDLSPHLFDTSGADTSHLHTTFHSRIDRNDDVSVLSEDSFGCDDWDWDSMMTDSTPLTTTASLSDCLPSKSNKCRDISPRVPVRRKSIVTDMPRVPVRRSSIVTDM